MAPKPLPPADLLRQLLRYEADEGKLYWKERPLEMFKRTRGRSAENCRAVWNAKYAGKIAGSAKRYIIIKIEGGTYQAHRVIWKMQTGQDPDEIDHLDRDKLNNRWVNLRDVDHSVNMKNKPISHLNTSGHKHVHWSGKLDRWVVQFAVPGKGRRQIAWKRTLSEAIAARDAAYSRFGYDIRTDAE